jgi:phosphopantothenoylcysteine decarboxylase/phosphopantothenate--cysteine ligase
MHGYGREVILGVGGGIAAYKSCDLLRRLLDRGFGVTVVPTPSSLNFVGAATWEALSGRSVTTSVFEDVHEVKHVSLAKKADFILIAPATADLIARIASGRADDLLTNCVLASESPIMIVPAMHPAMWTDPATVSNIETLRDRGFHVVDPDTGALTSGDTGVGRFPETSRILEEFEKVVGVTSDLLGVRVLVSAGGTREAIDPVRYIGNRSSGKQGYAVARAALKRGAKVTLIAANSVEADIDGAEVIHVESADQMFTAMQNRFSEAKIVVMAAAVADSKPVNTSVEKIKKSELLSIDLAPNIDIIATLAAQKSEGQIVIAFAAETSLDRAEATRKMKSKSADILYLNNVANGAIFNSEQTSGEIFISDGSILDIHEESKDTLANILLDKALGQLG